MSIGEMAVQYGQSLANQAKNLAVNQAQTLAKQAISKIPGNGLITSALGMLSGGGLSGIGGASAGKAEDFNKLRQLNHKLVHTEFIHEWDYRIEIDGAPTDFDIFVKDISYGLFEIGTDEEQYGMAVKSWPTTDQPCRVSMTVRDTYEVPITKYFFEWVGKVSNNDGTVGLPLGDNGYVKPVTLYEIKTSGEEIPLLRWRCYPIQLGDVTRSRENGNFMEMPATFAIFSSIGI